MTGGQEESPQLVLRPIYLDNRYLVVTNDLIKYNEFDLSRDVHRPPRDLVLVIDGPSLEAHVTCILLVASSAPWHICQL